MLKQMVSSLLWLATNRSEEAFAFGLRQQRTITTAEAKCVLANFFGSSQEGAWTIHVHGFFAHAVDLAVELSQDISEQFAASPAGQYQGQYIGEHAWLLVHGISFPRSRTSVRP